MDLIRFPFDLTPIAVSPVPAHYSRSKGMQSTSSAFSFPGYEVVMWNSEARASHRHAFRPVTLSAFATEMTVILPVTSLRMVANPTQDRYRDRSLYSRSTLAFCAKDTRGFNCWSWRAAASPTDGPYHQSLPTPKCGYREQRQVFGSRRGAVATGCILG
jgi:hypothetical protein